MLIRLNLKIRRFLVIALQNMSKVDNISRVKRNKRNY